MLLLSLLVLCVPSAPLAEFIELNFPLNFFLILAGIVVCPLALFTPQLN